MSILQTIAKKTKERYENEFQSGFSFEKSLKENKKGGISFICEVKKASPSKGIITDDFDYINIAKEYEKAGAAAISVLTEPCYFKGERKYLKEINDVVKTKTLRKDFVVNEYMIYEAKFLGASAILLICALLDKETLKRYIDIAHSIGLSALVEVHDENEIDMALSAHARVIGVNNRNLNDFSVDLNTCINLRKKVPTDVIFVAESGIKTKEDIRLLKENNVDAVLIGEQLMISENKKEMLNILADI